MRTQGEKRKKLKAPRKSAPLRKVTRVAPPADGTVDVIVKLGGAAITIKDGEPDTLNVDALITCCDAIAEVAPLKKSSWSSFAEESALRVIVVHGAGSYGHPQAKQYRVADGARDMDGDPVLREGVDKTKASVRKLCKLVCDELDSWLQMAPEVKLAPISPYGKFFTVGKKLNRNLSRGGFDEVRAALMEGKIPVLHGDVVDDAEQGCAILSGDTLVECLTEEFKPKRVVFVSDVEGIFTAKPLHKNGPCDLCPDGKTPPPALLREIQVNPDGSWIATQAFGPCTYLDLKYGVDRGEWRAWQREWQQANPLWQLSDETDEQVVESAVGTTDATVSLADNGDVTGGIKTKVQEAAAIALKGVDVFLTNHGDVFGIIKALYGHTAVDDEHDSRFVPIPHWIGTLVKMLAPEVENESPA